MTPPDGTPSEAALTPEMVLLLAQLAGVTSRLERAVDRLEGVAELEEVALHDDARQ